MLEKSLSTLLESGEASAQEILNHPELQEASEEIALRVYTSLLDRKSPFGRELRDRAAERSMVKITSDFGDAAAYELEDRVVDTVGGGVPVSNYPHLDDVNQVPYYLARAISETSRDHLTFLNVTDPHVGGGRERYVLDMQYRDEYDDARYVHVVTPDCGQVRKMGSLLSSLYPNAQFNLRNVNREAFQDLEEATRHRPHRSAVNYEGIDFSKLAAFLTLTPEIVGHLPGIFRPANFEETRDLGNGGNAFSDKFGNLHTEVQLDKVHEAFQVHVEDSDGVTLYNKRLEVTRGFPTGKEIIYITANNFASVAIGLGRFVDDKLNGQNGVHVTFTPTVD